jgi:hypothetical protein
VGFSVIFFFSFLISFFFIIVSFSFFSFWVFFFLSILVGIFSLSFLILLFLRKGKERKGKGRAYDVLGLVGQYGRGGGRWVPFLYHVNSCVFFFFFQFFFSGLIFTILLYII